MPHSSHRQMLQKGVDPNREPKHKKRKNNSWQINIYNLHTGLIAAPALIENAQIIPVTISANANDLADFDII